VTRVGGEAPWVGRRGQTPNRREGRHALSEDKHVESAGEGVTDEEFADQVAGQTSSDLKHADVFQREADGATTETEAAKASADDLADN
jgi:hypothetical protein